MKAVEDIELEALALAENDRADLVDRLMESLSQPQNRTAQATWLALAKKRRDEIRAGTVAGIPGEEGSAMVRKLVGR